MKHLIGNKIYLLPTMNYRKLGVPEIEQIKTAIVIKVGKLFVTISNNNKREEKLRFSIERNPRYLDAGYNSGYIYFESKTEIDEWIESHEISNRISSKFRYSSDYQDVDIKILRKIAELLGV